MSKTKEATQQNETMEGGQPAFVDELLTKGTTVLEASTREDLAELVNLIPAECKYMAGAVGFNPETGAFSLRVDINP